MLKGDLNERVRREVSAMEEKYRIPLILFYSSELSQAEIAEVMGIPTGTVKSRLHKAKELLRERLEVYYYCEA